MNHVSAKIDLIVPAQAPVFHSEAAQSSAPSAEQQEALAKARAAKAKEREERQARWKAIVDAGGSDAWVTAQLKAKGVFVASDPARLSDKEKSRYAEQKKLEAQERRVLRKQAWQAYVETHVNHLGHGVHWQENHDVDRFDIEKRVERADSLGLPDLANIDALAKEMNVPLWRLRSFAYHRDVANGSHYRRWHIPKRSGGQRTITAPKAELKAAQRWILRNIADRLPVHSAAHGFLAHRSIVSNALQHAGADVIVKVDIKDFFPTITWRRVRGMLRKAGLKESVATVLALISTESPREEVEFRGKRWFVAQGPRALPQGAPTSPAFSNAICMRLDKRMSGLSRKFGFKYTRYADDLTFSWRRPANNKQLDADPKNPAQQAGVGALLRGVKQILVSEGFRPHPDKTSVMRPGQRQMVTGLVVNNIPNGAKVRVPRETIRELRAALHQRLAGKAGKGETLEQLRGMVAFVQMSDPEKAKKFAAQIKQIEAMQNAAPSTTTA